MPGDKPWLNDPGHEYWKTHPGEYWARFPIFGAPLLPPPAPIPPAGGNPFLDYLEDRPEAGFFSFQDQWKTPNMRKFFQGQFSNIQNQYLGQLGQWVKAGSLGQPQKFSQFLSQFPWQQRFQELPPGERGQDTSRFSPFARWLV